MPRSVESKRVDPSQVGPLGACSSEPAGVAVVVALSRSVCTFPVSGANRVPFLIDGNNLMHAMASVGLDAGRSALCFLLENVLGDRESAVVVFDGPRRSEESLEEDGTSPLDIRFSGRRVADAILIEEIRANSAPRRLTVVSTDREVRTAARRRRCPLVTSEAFAEELRRRKWSLDRPVSPSPEPKEKREGLTEGQTRHWLREFGLKSDDDPAPGECSEE
jgi:uncharacterized protein